MNMKRLHVPLNASVVSQCWDIWPHLRRPQACRAAASCPKLKWACAQHLQVEIWYEPLSLLVA